MLIDRYVFSEWLKVFLLSLFVLFGLLIIGDIQDDLPDLLGFGAGQSEITRYYLIKAPSFVPVVLPVAFMVSLLFSLGQFHRNHELTAMRVAGCSLFRITRSLWAMAVVLTISLFQLNANLVPWSVEQSRETWNDLAYSKAIAEDVPEEQVGLLYNMTFFNRKDGRLWFINRFNEYNYRAYGLTVSEIRAGDGVELRRYVANEGYYDDLGGGWTFLEGRQTEFSETTGEPVRSLAFEELRLRSFTEDPDLMKALEKEAKDLSLSELKSVVDYLRPAEDPRLATYAVTFYDRLLSPVSCLVIIGLAIPFSVSGVRTNPFVSVSKAMGLFLLYYLLVNVAQLVGAGGFSPLWAALIPNIAAFGLIGYYFLKLQHP
ncbi:MAG: LptF/LptG family permease [Oceanipulchritudo sp.]